MGVWIQPAVSASSSNTRSSRQAVCFAAQHQNKRGKTEKEIAKMP